LFLFGLIAYSYLALAEDKSGGSLNAVFLQEIPHFVEDLGKAKTISGDLGLYLAKNESEGAGIRLTASKEQTVHISVTCSENNFLIFEIFEIKGVP
jgi:hypothetical protein